MWRSLVCHRPWNGVRNSTNTVEFICFAPQLRQLSDDTRIKQKHKAVWSKQIDELAKKRDMLKKIHNEIMQQEIHINHMLRHNKRLLLAAIFSFNDSSKEQPPVGPS